MSKPRFVRYGRTRHLRIRDAEDLRHILSLSRTRWIATAAPISAFHLDPEFLRHLDADADGRVLPSELRRTISWTLDLLSSHDGLEAGSGELDPKAVNGAHADGERILRALSLAGAGPVSCSSLREAARALADRARSEAESLRPPAPFLSLRSKIDEYFLLCRAARLAGVANHADERLVAAVRDGDAGSVRQALLDLPLAALSADGRLPLRSGANPTYAEALADLREHAVAPVLGDREAIDEDEWRTIVARYSSSADAHERTDDENALLLAMKLSLFQQHLVCFVNSLVSCPDLYHEDRRAAFEAGTLYLGGYALTFAVRVDDRTFHAEIARSSNIFVVYASIYSTGQPLYEIAVPVTAGNGRRLFRGKRGVFIDTAGVEWNAEVVQIVSNPVSLAEAIVAPFRRFSELLTGRIESVAREAEVRLDSLVASPPGSAAAVPQPPQPRLGMIGFAGAGLGIAAVTSALAYVTSALSGVPWWHIAIGVVGALAAVAAPALIVGLIRLSRRDLSIILEGAKWAMNSPLRLTYRQGRFFTRKARKTRRN